MKPTETLIGEQVKKCIKKTTNIHFFIEVKKSHGKKNMTNLFYVLHAHVTSVRFWIRHLYPIGQGFERHAFLDLKCFLIIYLLKISYNFILPRVQKILFRVVTDEALKKILQLGMLIWHANRLWFYFFWKSKIYITNLKSSSNFT